MPLLLLAIVFVILKVTGTVGWSWWWVLSPLILLAIVRFLLGMGVGNRRR